MAAALPPAESITRTILSQNQRTSPESGYPNVLSGRGFRMTRPDDPTARFRQRTNGPVLQTHGPTKSGAFFKGLSPKVLSEFQSMEHSAYYEDGSLLFSEGQFPECVYLVIEGSVKLSVNSTDGHRLTHRVASQGEIMGMTAVILDIPYDSTAEALHACKVASISKREFCAFLIRHPDTQSAAMKELSVQYMELCNTLRLLSLNSNTTKKLARLLLNWSSAADETEEDSRIRICMTHEEIGQFVGASRETVTRTFTDFKQKRLIELHGSIMTIPNKLALEKIAEYIGPNNVRRHSPKDLSTIELELDHLQIQCSLHASFWRDRPAISDPRLSTWLEAKHPNERCRNTAVLKMVRSGKRSFRLQLVDCGPPAKVFPDRAE